ncbi:hypothetical protein BDV25DRAFT_157162 [Aspergillus avenaceus]|uniref:Zn(2)-C6 fungal-type domain-containing protein n=1 Tax=Aspergillus avenaceus TaxID=36643 RepID=A0A5N6TRS4_ASPAV|nr:hypothetical protein BDV25DRAFT_157162 [Aspergillus avenaceus]
MTGHKRAGSVPPPRKRRRPAKSCEQCRRRKIRCDLQMPCRACKQARETLDCTYRELTPPIQPESHTVQNNLDGGSPFRSEHLLQDIPQSFHGSENVRSVQEDPLDATTSETDRRDGIIQHLSDRLRKAEQQLSELSRAPQPAPMDTGLIAPATVPRLRSTADKTRMFGPSHWIHTAQQIDFSQIDPKSMDFDIGELKSDLADMAKECKRLRQSAKSQRSLLLNDPVPNLAETFPEKHICDELASAYMRTFEHIYRVFHIPSFWKEYHQFWEAPNSASATFLIKLGLVFAVGATFYPSWVESDHLRRLARTWIYAAQWWLVGPSEKSTRNLDGIQIFCLLLVSRQTNTIGISPWLSVGSLLRMAMTMGLHRNPQVFPNLSSFHSEMRVRLWTTILELTVHASVDSSSMPLLLSVEDFDDHVPRNISDSDFTPDMTSNLPTPFTLEKFTESSAQLLLRQSLPLRMRAAKMISNFNEKQSYSAALQLATDLQKACRDIAVYFQVRWSQSLDRIKMHQKFLDMQLRRYILLLHRPFMLQARQNPHFYLSRKICVESAMVVASYAEDINLPSEELDDLSRLMVLSTGPFNGALHLDIIAVLGLEAVSQVKEAETSLSEVGHFITDPLGEVTRSQRQSIIRILEHINDQLLQVITLGIPRFKRYIFLSGLLRQIHAMESGTSNVRPLVIKALQESVRQCFTALQTSHTVNTPQGSIDTLICSDASIGLDFDIKDPNLDFSALLFSQLGESYGMGL